MTITKAYEKVLEEQLIESIRQDSDIYIGSTDDLFEELVFENIISETEHEELFVYIAEELTFDEMDKADRMRDSGHSYYNEAFTSMHPLAHAMFTAHAPKEGKGRVRIPLTLDMSEIPANSLVKGHLLGHGWDIHDYGAGIAKKTVTVGNPEKGIPYQTKEVKKNIGKILNETDAPQHVKKAFTNDSQRNGSTNNQYDMILSHNNHDVYGMSTGRGWVSCATMRKGCEKFNGNGPATKHMRDEINGQTHVAYLVPRGGDVNKDAIARLNFKRHSPLGGGKDTLIADNTVYGDAPQPFRKAAIEKVGELFPVDKSKIYRPHGNTYNDNGLHFRFNENENGEVSPESIDEAWKSLNHRNVRDSGMGRRQLLGKLNPDAKYKSRTLNQIASKFKDAKAYANAGQFHKAIDSFDDIEVPDKLDYMYLAGHHLGSVHINNAIDAVANSFDRENPEHMQKFANRYGQYHNNDVVSTTLSRALAKYTNKPIKTVDDAVSAIHMRSYEPNASTQKFIIDPNHKLGAFPLKKIAEGLAEKGQLNHETAKHLYHGFSGTGKRSGNYYDLLADFHKMGLNGSSELIKHTADERKKNASSDRIAELLYRTKPDNRQLWADAIGVDHKELIKKHGPAIRKKDREIKQYIEKQRAAQEMAARNAQE